MPACKYQEVCGLDGVETSEGTYCILHSPDPQKNVARFDEELRKYQARVSFNFRHFVFPPKRLQFKEWFGGTSIGHLLDMSGTIVFGGVYLCDINLNEGADFKNAVFCDEVTFGRSSFGGFTNFTKAHFKNFVNFEDTKFTGRVNLIDSIFEGEVNFSSSTRRTCFGERVDFRRARFLDNASFSDVQFAQEADFTGTDFNATCDFSKAEFRGETKFDSTKFRSAVSFRSAQFNGISTFRGDGQEQIFSGVVDLQEIRVKEKHILRLINVNLAMAQLCDAAISNIDFVGVRWHRIGFRFGVYDESLIAGDVRVPSLPDVEKIYRQLKQNYEERRDFGRAGDFHMGEKEMQLRNPSTPVGTRITLSLYKFTNGYGERIARPLYFFGFVILYVAGFSLIGGLFDESAQRFLNLRSFGDCSAALLFAMDKAFHLPGEYFVPALSVRWLQTLAGVLGPLFIALAGLAMRNRLRR